MGSTLLDLEKLERSAVVANCRMNRDRSLSGTNGYARELGFEPLEFLTTCASTGRPVRWFDVCCGSGRAIVEAAGRALRDDFPGGLVLNGLDLIDAFVDARDLAFPVTFHAGSVSTWEPDLPCDLITCVHGLHYIGDKLGFISRALRGLTENGMFIAHLDLANLRLLDQPDGAKRIVSQLRHGGITYNARTRRLVGRGLKVLALPFEFAGADDQAGPNYTGQEAVTAYYTQR